jgi:hypothetical protein
MAGFGIKSRLLTIAASNTAQPLATSSHQGYAQMMILRARSANSGNIYISDSSVDANCFAIEPGGVFTAQDFSKAYGRENLNLTEIYVYGTINDVLEVAYERSV